MKIYLILILFLFSVNAEDKLGQGEFTYKVIKDWGVLDPVKYPVKDCQAMVTDASGRLILLTNHTKNNVIIYDQSGAVISSWGTSFKGAHGLSITQHKGKEYLYITDTDQNKVYRTTLEGKIELELDYPKETGKYKNAKQFRPATVVPGSNGDFYVLDGYGINYIIHYNWEGKIIRIFGGDIGEGEAQLKKWGPHGGLIDNRDKENPLLLICCSDQNKMKRFTLDGKYVDTIPMPGGNPRHGIIIGRHLFVVNMSSNWPKDRSACGYISVFDMNYKIIANIGGTAPVYKDGKLQKMTHLKSVFKFPHGLTADDKGNLYVAQWQSGSTYPIKLENIEK